MPQGPRKRWVLRIRNIKLCVTIFIWLENTCASNFHHLKNYWLFLYFRTLMVTSSASCSIWRIAVFALLNRIRIHSWLYECLRCKIMCFVILNYKYVGQAFLEGIRKLILQFLYPTIEYQYYDYTFWNTNDLVQGRNVMLSLFRAVVTLVPKVTELSLVLIRWELI